MIKFPCKVHNIIYEPVGRQISEFEVVSFGYDGKNIWLNLKCLKGMVSRHTADIKDIGKKVFLTKGECK